MKRYWVGEPVLRVDGRSYIPINRIHAMPCVPSQIVCHVPSEAFIDLVEAQHFAYALCYALDHK